MPALATLPELAFTVTSVNQPKGRSSFWSIAHFPAVTFFHVLSVCEAVYIISEILDLKAHRVTSPPRGRSDSAGLLDS